MVWAEDISGDDCPEVSKYVSRLVEGMMSLESGLTSTRFMVMGPHQAYGNNPRSIEYASFWITEALRYFEDHDISYVEATQEGVDRWTQRKHISLHHSDLDIQLTHAAFPRRNRINRRPTFRGSRLVDDRC